MLFKTVTGEEMFNTCRFEKKERGQNLEAKNVVKIFLIAFPGGGFLVVLRETF